MDKYFDPNMANFLVSVFESDRITFGSANCLVNIVFIIKHVNIRPTWNNPMNAISLHNIITAQYLSGLYVVYS